MSHRKLRRVSVAVCASQLESSLSGFIKLLRDEFPDVVQRVEFIEIPYNGIDNFRFKDHVDVMLLVHSIHNRRFSLTNVMDALYDKFLLMARKFVGKGKIGVVVHDFKHPVSADEMKQRMITFRYQQPLTFECSNLVFTCGKLDQEQGLQIDDEDLTKLRSFLESTRHLPERVKRDGLGWRLLHITFVFGAALVSLLGLLYFRFLNRDLQEIMDGDAVADSMLETEL